MAAVTPEACEECSAPLDAEALAANLWCCPSCGFHLPMPVRPRLALVVDPGTAGAEVSQVTGSDPLSFADARPYPARMEAARSATGLSEAFIAVGAEIGGVASVVGALDFRFMGGTMSSAVGERIACAFERASDERRAIVLFTSSGGARMQEGTLSLFQMTKTAAALARFRRVRRPYVSVVCHPTLGGVSASFAPRADVVLAEPRARIGFAGPRVVEQLIGRKLPPQFQRAEFVAENGFVDRIVPRTALREELVRLVPLLAGGET